MKTLAIIQGGGCRQIENAIGILKAIEEAGYKINRYRGASAGAIVSGLHSSGMSASDMEALIRNTPIDELFSFSWWQGFKLLVPGVKVNHVYDTSGLLKLLKEHMTGKAIGKARVTLTRLPDYVSEIKPATPETVLASSAIPEVFPPVKLGTFCYADGGIIDNIPTIPISTVGKYQHIFIILCNKDTKTNKTSWTKVGRALKAVNETMDRETHQIFESGWDEFPNVTVIQPPPYRSHLLEWSGNFGLIEHSYNYCKCLLTKV